MSLAELFSLIREKFPDSTVAGGKVNDLDIINAEQELGLQLPADYKTFLIEFNGIIIQSDEIFGINTSYSHLDILQIYIREHTEVEYPMPNHLIPFSPNGRGDHYCFDISAIDSNGICPILFWQWDYSFFNPHDIDKTHNSFTDWLKELLTDLISFK